MIIHHGSKNLFIEILMLHYCSYYLSSEFRIKNLLNIYPLDMSLYIFIDIAWYIENSLANFKKMNESP